MRYFLCLVAVVLLLSGCGSIDNAADRDAEVQVETLAKALSRALFWKTEEFGFFVTRQEGVDLLVIRGDKRDSADPLKLVVRVVGSGAAGDSSVKSGVPTPLPAAVRCFELAVYYSDVDFGGVSCPQGAASLHFPAPPGFPSWIVERLKDTLPRKSDLAKVRQAVARLDLDRGITQEIIEREGVIGVALREGTDGTCLYARVMAGRVEVWYPYRIVPGGDDVESCSVIGAVNGYVERANH